jgi:3-phenylpropionate/trans-cinnamate dioxygenase ferredoxin reductase subunit
MKGKVVIIGTGQAGVQAATSLRAEGFEGSIVMISDEASTPYQKPTLSKEFLLDTVSEERIALKPGSFFSNKSIDLVLGDAAVSIDTVQQKVVLKSSNIFDFDHLIIATGARNRVLSLNGKIVDDINYLRTLEECQSLKKSFHSIRKLVIIGGGFIGLEIAASARKKDIEVDVIELQPKLMSRVLPALISDVFEAEHLKNGVRLHFEKSVIAIHPSETNARIIELSDGTKITADLIVAGIGVIPNDDIAKAAGIHCTNGIEVDEFNRTNYKNIYAIGDCAFHYNPFMGEKVRLESIQNAMDQGMTVAAHIMKKNEPYHKTPWFWTNQYDLKLQMAGNNQGFSHYFLRGSLEDLKFSVFYFRGNDLIGVDSLNRGSDHMVARKLLQAGVHPTKEQVEDEEYKLKELLPTTNE